MFFFLLLLLVYNEHQVISTSVAPDTKRQGHPNICAVDLHHPCCAAALRLFQVPVHQIHMLVTYPVLSLLRSVFMHLVSNFDTWIWTLDEEKERK